MSHRFRQRDAIQRLSGREPKIVIKRNPWYVMNTMLNEFIEKKLKQAKYKILKDGNYFAEIPGVRGVWASAKNIEDCRSELREVLEEWFFLKLKSGERISGFSLRMDRRELVKNA